jgi:hypothetical protein
MSVLESATAKAASPLSPTSLWLMSRNVKDTGRDVDCTTILGVRRLGRPDTSCTRDHIPPNANFFDENVSLAQGVQFFVVVPMVHTASHTRTCVLVT